MSCVRRSLGRWGWWAVADVRHTFTAKLAGPEHARHLPLACELCYSPRDPWATRLHIQEPGPAGEVVEWAFSRELLAAGLAAGASDRAGVGDVTVGPAPLPHPGRRMLLLTLSSPDGVCRLLLPRDTVAAFLARTWQLVPAGAEQVDWDAAIAALLRAGELS